MTKSNYTLIPIDEALASDVEDDVVAINRSAAVVKGGRRFSFSALTVVGNRNGLVGIGYGKGRESTGEQGELVAAFDGSHGWFWRNRSGAPVTITLRTEGAYGEVKRVV